MKRKLVALLLTTCVAAAAFAGCGSNKSDSKKSTDKTDTSSDSTDTEESDESDDTEDETVMRVELTASTIDYSEYVTLGEYKGLEIEVSSTDVTDDQLQEAIDDVISAGTVAEQVTDNPVEDGDTINLDFAGYYINDDGSKGDAFDGGTAEGYTYTVGGSFITDLNDQLIGLECGKEYDLTCTFPEDYGSDDLNGVTVIFTVTVNYVEGDDIVPEWNDDFINEYTDGEYTSTADYEAYLKDSLLAENEESQLEEFQTSVVTTVMNNFEVSDYPQDRVDEIYENMYSYYKSMYEYYAEYYGVTYEELMEEYGLSDEELQSDCLDQTKTQLQYIMVTSMIAQAEGITLTEDEYNDTAIEYLTSAGYDTIADFEADYGQQYLYESFLADKVCEQLYELNTMKVS